MLLLNHASVLLLLITGKFALLSILLLLKKFLVLLRVLKSRVAAAEGLHKFSHGLCHVLVELTLFSIHTLHVLLCVLNLPPSAIDVLVVFLRMTMTVLLCFLSHVHALSVRFEETAQDVEAMSCSGAAVLDGWYPANIWVTSLLLFFLERKVLIQFCNISNFLQLIRVTLNLLLQVLDTLGNTLGNLQVVLNLFH